MSEFQKQLDALRRARADTTTDTINRQAVLSLAKDVILINGAKHRCIDATQIHELPSAERKGKWVNHRNDDGHNIADCNLCGSTLQWFDNDGEHNYCPNCGARMVSE